MKEVLSKTDVAPGLVRIRRARLVDLSPIWSLENGRCLENSAKDDSENNAKFLNF